MRYERDDCPERFEKLEEVLQAIADSEGGIVADYLLVEAAESCRTGIDLDILGARAFADFDELSIYFGERTGGFEPFNNYCFFFEGEESTETHVVALVWIPGVDYDVNSYAIVRPSNVGVVPDDYRPVVQRLPQRVTGEKLVCLVPLPRLDLVSHGAVVPIR